MHAPTNISVACGLHLTSVSNDTVACALHVHQNVGEKMCKKEKENSYLPLYLFEYGIT